MADTFTPELLASVEDLRIFLDDPTLDEDRSNLFLRIASGEVRAYTGNLFSWTEGDVLTLDGTGSRALILPVAPVAAVNEVVENPGRSSEVTLVEDEDFEWSADGFLRRVDGGFFSSRLRSYRVDVDHGFEIIPDEVEGIVLAAAGRAFENPDGVRSETLGRYSYTKAGDEAGVGLFKAETDTLAPYMIGTKMRAGTAVAAGSGS